MTEQNEQQNQAKEVAVVKVVNPATYNLEPQKGEELTKGLIPVRQEREALMDEYNAILTLDLDNPDTEKRAKALAQKLVKVRTQGIDKWHKAAKEFHLRAGQFVDAIKNAEYAAIEYMEQNVATIAKYRENKEKERKATIKAERTEKLAQYVDDTSVFQFDSMSDEAFAQLLEGQRLAKEARIAQEKKDAEIAAENQRKAERLKQMNDEVAKYKPYLDHYEVEIEVMSGDTPQETFDKVIELCKDYKTRFDKEQAELQAENDRLKKEQEKRDKEAAAQMALQSKRQEELRPYLQFIRNYSDMLRLPEEEYAKELADVKKGAEQHWEYERKREADAQKALDEAEKIRKEKEYREKAEKEKRDKEAAEAKRLAAAPDKEKLNAFINAIVLPATPAMSTNEYAAAIIQIQEEFAEFKKLAIERAKQAETSNG